MSPAPTTAVADALLAFDTSTEQLSIGLSVGGRHWTAELSGGAAASRTLLPAVHRLLQGAGRSLREVMVVAFGRGPGAFTGLRTSCAVAQGLAFGLRLPVLPIDSLLIVAEQVRHELQEATSLDVGVAMDARMGELYAARFRWHAAGAADESAASGAADDGAASGPVWEVLSPSRLCSPQDLADAWAGQPPQAIAGSGLDLLQAALPPACAATRRVRVGDNRASALLALAGRAWAAGAGVDAAQALPLYLRDKVAQTTAERAALRPTIAG